MLVYKPTFSEKEIEKLLAQPDRHSNEGFRDYTIMLTLVDTGVRLSELAELKATAIDYEQNLFRVMGKGSREPLSHLDGGLPRH